MSVSTYRWYHRAYLFFFLASIDLRRPVNAEPGRGEQAGEKHRAARLVAGGVHHVPPKDGREIPTEVPHR
jgi:hypothetical protein